MASNNYIGLQMNLNWNCLLLDYSHNIITYDHSGQIIELSKLLKRSKGMSKESSGLLGFNSDWSEQLCSR